MFIPVHPWLNRRVRKRIQIALTIAGSDSGGGAGLQADLKTFAALGVHGTSVVTCLTAQNPKQVSGVEACSPRFIRAQFEALFSELPPRAAKTGMLFSAAIIREVARAFRDRPCPLVVDPVMIATSGSALLRREAVRALTEKLLPLATLITPNVPEAEALLGITIREPEDLRRAAHTLHERFGGAVLMKGGHLATTREAIDFFYDGRVELLLSSPRVRGIHTHGTGCTCSAAITAGLARGQTLVRAVQQAKDFVTHAIATSHKAGRHDVLNTLRGRPTR